MLLSMTRQSMRTCSSVFAILAVMPNAVAATYTAASCSRSDVGAAVSLATHGDVVIIPPGDCTWTTELRVTAGIHLKGSGQGVTTIRDNVPKDGSMTSRLISATVNAPNRFRLSDLTFVGVATDPNIYNQGHIYVDGTQTAFRIHHFTFNSPQTTVIRTGGAALGLIDNCTLNGSRNLLTALTPSWGGSSYGDGSWSEPISWGSDRAIYVEDCTLKAATNPFTANFIDGFEGARIVFRHNRVEQGNVTSHGTDSGGRRRGIRQMEVYNNSFVFPAGMAVDFIVWIRGGTGVVFGNTVTVPGGVNRLVKLFNCRDSDAGCGGPSYAPWGACTGSSVYDQNTPGQTGYRCVDQPGSGTSRHLGGLATPTAEWVGNALDPVYVWGNTISVTPTFAVASGTIHVQANRDYYVGTPRPGYTPLTYPHPLRSGESGGSPPPPSAPNPPTDLRATVN